MRIVNIKVVDKGNNSATVGMVLDKVYPAVRFEDGEFDERGDICVNVRYVLHDEVGDRVGLYLDYHGVVIEEV